MTPLLFIICPFGFLLARGEIHLGHHLFFTVSLLFIAASFIQRLPLKLLFYYIGIWVIYVMVHSFFIGSKGNHNLFAYREVFYYAAAIMIYIDVVKSKWNNEVFYNLICIAALVQCAICIGQFWGHDLLVSTLSHFMEVRKKLGITELTGTMGNTNFCAAYLSISLPFFFRKYWAALIPIVLICIVGTKTTTAIATCAIITMVMAGNYVKKEYILIVAAFSLALVPAYTYLCDNNLTGMSERIEFWVIAWERITSSWKTVLFGNGFGQTWGHQFPMHNDWLQLVYKFGLTGFVLFSWYLVTLPRKNIILVAALAGSGINAIANNPMHMAPTAFLICLIFGLAERERHGQLSIIP